LKKVLLYILAVILGAWGLLSGLRAIEWLLTGGLSAYGIGRLAGSVLIAVLFILLAAKALAKARAA
jgi:hypothetical protein